MNTANKTLLACLCIGLALTITTITIASERREGESAEAYAQRIGGEEKEKKTNEALSWTDAGYIAVSGYESFSHSANYIRLSLGQKKTFFEDWMRYGIKNNLIMDMCNARRNAVAALIAIDSQLLDQAANLINNDMHEGMLFLTRTLSPAQVQAIGNDLQKLSASAKG